eukprot:jgi/Mesvir1/6893/Mv09055-RA.1
MYADLKKWRFYYWFAFPALVLPHAAESSPPRPLAQEFAGEQLAGICAALTEWISPCKAPSGGPPGGGLDDRPLEESSTAVLDSSGTAGTSQPAPCALLPICSREAGGELPPTAETGATRPKGARVLPLTHLTRCREMGVLTDVLLAYVCPGVLPTHPSWCLRNLLFLAWHEWTRDRASPTPSTTTATPSSTVHPTSATPATATVPDDGTPAHGEEGRPRDARGPSDALHLRVLCYRERSPGVVSEERSLVLDVRLPAGSLGPTEAAGGSLPVEESREDSGPSGPDRVKFVGWEHNAQGKLAPRMVDLTSALNPYALAETAVDLNLSLMRWRLMPSLATERIAATSCLLLGAGTLGCQVARCLMGWGVRKFTFVDNGRVAYSNPVRQSLFVFDDCLDGGKPKAEAAAERARAIFPGVTAVGHALNIPMIGHAVGDAEGDVSRTMADLAALTDLILAHDVVFLLTDTRESRWLPTLLCAAHNKLALNVALGFDSYLVMRHGCDNDPAVASGPRPEGTGASTHTRSMAQVHAKEEEDNVVGVVGRGQVAGGTESKGPVPPPRLGCYFCNDVVAPIDSTTGRSLDQQCTVTRPGLSCIAGALAVELMVSVLQHPRRGSAPADGPRDLSEATTLPFGDVPHQLRGFLPVFRQMVITGQAFDRCTACSAKVISEYRARGPAFVLQALNSPAYLEEITGLAAMKSAVDDDQLEWENDGGSEDDDF